MTDITQAIADDAVEAVAQAIADAQHGAQFNGLDWPEAWSHFEDLARAAIAAWNTRAPVEQIAALPADVAGEMLDSPATVGTLQLAKLNTKIEWLQKTLEKYGEHPTTCPAFFESSHECECGFAAALKGIGNG